MNDNERLVLGLHPKFSVVQKFAKRCTGPG